MPQTHVGDVQLTNPPLWWFGLCGKGTNITLGQRHHERQLKTIYSSESRNKVLCVNKNLISLKGPDRKCLRATEVCVDCV